MALSKDEILNRKPRVTEILVPEWNGSVFVKIMSAGQREEWERTFDQVKESSHVRVDLLVRTLCDENGTLLFSREDLESLNQVDSDVVGILFNKARDINGLTAKEVDEAKNDLTPVQ